MSMSTSEELLFRFGQIKDPEIEARRQHILEVLMKVDPQMQQRLIDKSLLEGRLTEARAALRRVLARRQLTLGQDDDARIEACTDLATLEGWLDRAVTAASVSDALA
jgi:hypothetical protein